MKKYYEEPDFKTVMFTVIDVIMASDGSGGKFTEEDLTIADDGDWSTSTAGW